MTAAVWTVPELKEETISAAVRIVWLLTITWMLRLVTAVVLTVVWIPAFRSLYRGREDMILFDHPIAAIRYAVPMVRPCSLKSMSGGTRSGTGPTVK